MSRARGLSDGGLTAGAKYRIRDGYVLRQVVGEYVIVPTASDGLIVNGMLSPNDSAVFLWQIFSQPSTVDEAVEKGMEEYDVDEQTLRGSVCRFVTELLLLQILEEMD